MPAPLEIIVTNAGRAAIVNAQNTGTAPVTITQIGLSGTAVTPLPTSAALTGEFKRVAAIAGEVVADDTIHVTLTDTSGDAYSLRSIGLYLADGTLFAIYGQVAPVLEKTAQSIAALSIDVIFADIAAAALTFGDATFTNPPATTERQGVVELATVAEAQAGIDALRALTASAAKAAILGWLLSQDGSGSGLDADLLDGQDGSYYSNIIARLGYTPANRAGDTFSGPIRRDGAFYFDFSASNPLINFDAADYFVFDRAGNSLYLTIGGVTRATFTSDGWLGMQSGFSVNGNLVWHAGNDGAGSGLDADLLDGQDSSYYVNIPARLGYTPANKAGDTFSGPIRRDAGYYLDFQSSNPILNFDAFDYFAYDRTANSLSLYINGTARATFTNDGWLWTQTGFSVNGNLVWHAGNDGAGSGSDADLLDGQHGSYYSNIPARLGYNPANAAGQTFSGPIGRDSAFYLDFVSGGPLINFDANDYLNYDRVNNALQIVLGGQARMIQRASGALDFYGTSSVYFNGVNVWHAGNDGSGSGLDADLLDGFHASDLLRVISESKAGSGYMQLSNGLLLQWGRWTSSPTPGAALNINFPVAFSAEPFTLVTMPVVTTSSGATTWSSDGITGSAFPARCSIASIGCRYFAIGPV
jgi:hypothetical protein